MKLVILGKIQRLIISNIVSDILWKQKQLKRKLFPPAVHHIKLKHQQSNQVSPVQFSSRQFSSFTVLIDLLSFLFNCTLTLLSTGTNFFGAGNGTFSPEFVRLLSGRYYPASTQTQRYQQ